MTAYDWLKELKVGSPVVVIHRGRGYRTDQISVQKIERETKTLFIIGDAKFAKTTGFNSPLCQYGGNKVLSQYSEEIAQNIQEKNQRSALIEFFRTINPEALPNVCLTQIKSLVVNA